MQEYLDVMPRSVKRLIMIIADAVFVGVALWAGFALRLGEALSPHVQSFWWLFIVLPPISLPVFAAFGFYRMVVRYMGPHAVFSLAAGISVSTLVLTAITLMAGAYSFPRSVAVLYWLLVLLLIGGSRFVVRAYLLHKTGGGGTKRPVIIYGAGSSGARLVSILAAGQEYHPIAMIDDARSLHGSVVNGVPVYRPSRLGELVDAYRVRHVLLALPSTSRSRRKQILTRLEAFPVHVKTIPGLIDLVSGNARLDELREVDVEDLLGRDPVDPDPGLMAACITNRVVLVTGAGGSIGSELCRQIIHSKPRCLILFEISEYALYGIDKDLRSLLSQHKLDVEIVPLLGSVTDKDRLRGAMETFKVQTVYHAAAYKHVPIVEQNVLEGVHNNVLGTWYAAEAAQAAGVTDFVLISTDKAVRPTNVMGASKRLAEMVLQGMAQASKVTIFSMVRFGNVLGSSGSVVPLFREQVQRGGPVTVTHPEITRYFMTIPEAATLVIQAGAMATGGDVFVLDMGKPVRIVELAREMIRLMGYQVRDEHNLDGDIEITFTGLRPGEKLYEELLIGNNVSGTLHPKINRAQEHAPSWRQMSDVLDQLEQLLLNEDVEGVRALLLELVQGYITGARSRDLVWTRTHHVDTEEALAPNVTALQPPVKR